MHVSSPTLPPAPWFPLGHFSDLGTAGSALWEQRCNLIASKAQLFLSFQFCPLVGFQAFLGGQRMGNVSCANWSVSQDPPSPGCLPGSLRAVNSANGGG